ncbi:Helicase-like transcription factor [Trametes pubescens]|uniref:Helicase-like transcription factor n=1 Tax=Trametes pubescens TaxID=154538 RepID=A0A1M2VHS7_TRAPU|nr:Helicase-like transcription factor [Trametes pubescens]
MSYPPRVEEEVAEEVVEEESRDELYLMLKTSIVGIQYYKGPYSSYSDITELTLLQVWSDRANKCGSFESPITNTIGTLFKSKISEARKTLKVYGPADKRQILESKLVWATPGQRGFPKPDANGVRAIPGAPTPRVAPAPARAPAPSQAGPSYSQALSAPSSAAPGYGSASRNAAASTQRARATAAQQEAVRKQQEAQRKQQEAYEKAMELRQILNNLEKVDDEGRRSSLLDTLCSVDDVLSLPEHPNPPGIGTGELMVNLLKHQSQALKWCIDHEYPELPKTEADRPVQFWQLRKGVSGKPYYFNIATKTPQEAPPALGRGALCADSMGLGKTLTMLALVLATKSDTPIDHSNSTLIVVPLSVMSNWEKQIEDHVKPGTLSYCVYYGKSRSLTPAELRRYDVVITTYQTVALEHDLGATAKGGAPAVKKQKVDKALFDVAWKRIILDEGHSIRNPRTKMAKAVYALPAQRRWVLTGTPIINSPKDLGSILTFLRICNPLDQEDFFKRMLLRPLKDGDPAGAELLRALMSHICIRRTKEMQDKDGKPLVPLPPVEMTVVPVALTPKAREMYDAVEELSKQRVGNLLAQHGTMHAAAVQSNVLSLLTRMRQLALHPGLLPPNYLQQLEGSGESNDSDAPAPVQVTPQERIRLQNVLAQGIEDCEECPVCFGELNEPRITFCGHMFCLACITEVIARDPKCPMDRRPLGTGNLIEPPPPTDLTQAPVRFDDDDEDEEDSDLRNGSSAKIDQLVTLLRLTPETDKSLVFSQFTGFLDKIAETLEKEGIPYVRFDGKMSARRRQETIARFSVPINPGEVTTTPPLSQVAQLPSSQPSEPISSQRSARRRTRSSQSILLDGSIDDDKDDDFIIFDPSSDDDDDDDFVDDENVPPTRTQAAKKGKGKAKGGAKGKGKKTARVSDLVPEEFIPATSDVNPRVMLISLKAGALGLNLTVANNVYLMDPWWQEGIESQAIDRCNRIGQTKPVHVYQLIAEDTVESKVIEIQEKKKKLVQEAFAGIKNAETQRQKKEARLQELVHLFGLQKNALARANGGAGESQSTLDQFRA